MSGYTVPEYRTSTFNCPHCGVKAHQTWIQLVGISDEHWHGSRELHGYEASVCAHCREYTIWRMGKLAYPMTQAGPQPSPDLPQDVVPDYEEARAVLAASPRASAALLRLVIQKLCQRLVDKPSRDLNSDIGRLVKSGLRPEIQKALDVVRVIGNNAVHPLEMDLGDDHKTALVLFDLVNLIVQDMITRPRTIEELYQKLPEKAREGIEKRDRSTTVGTSAEDGAKPD